MEEVKIERQRMAYNAAMDAIGLVGTALNRCPRVGTRVDGTGYLTSQHGTGEQLSGPAPSCALAFTPCRSVLLLEGEADESPGNLD